MQYFVTKTLTYHYRQLAIQVGVDRRSVHQPCSETYKGLAAGDTPELKAVKAQVDALRASRGISLYLDVQYVSDPFSL